MKKRPHSSRKFYQRIKAKYGVCPNTLYLRRLRQAAIAYLGGQCVECGFSDARILQFDHIKNNGGKERKKYMSKSGTVSALYQYRLYRDILDGKRPDIQLLCPNCNWLKRVEFRGRDYLA